MEKLDLMKLFKQCYVSKTTPELVHVEPSHFLAMDGRGDPSRSDFSDSAQALYAVAYAIKFMCRWDNNDFVMPKLEGLWWYDEQRFPDVASEAAPQTMPRQNWHYRLLLRMPDFVCHDLVSLATEQVMQEKNLSKARRVFLTSMTEGNSVQVLHVGPFDTGPKTLQRLHAFIEINQLQRSGKHHEIYLSDFRKTPPEKLKTILRQPVESL